MARVRTGWFFGTLVGTAAAFLLAVVLAPTEGAGAGVALTALLFFGSSAHVASTAWFATRPEVRAEARRRPGRYALAPVALVVGAAVLAAALLPTQQAWPLLAFFGWQFFHFQKQNLGLTALALVSHGAPSLDAKERAVIVGAGVAGTVGLVAHPELLQLDLASPVRALFLPAAAATAVLAVAGIVLVRRRPAPARPAPAVALVAMSLLFFVPVFVFRSPFAAVSGIVIAHGLQYLLLMGLVAAGEPNRNGDAHRGSPEDTGHQERIVAVALLVNLALVGGMALSVASHQHDGGPAQRAVYGAFLGVTMAHFVVDAAIWRLRDDFPRRFLAPRLPALLPVADAAHADGG